MQVMDSVRRGEPKPDWVLACHALAPSVLLSVFIAVLTISAYSVFQGRSGSARRMLVSGSGAILAVSAMVLVLMWV